jgi:hypothetical protein
LVSDHKGTGSMTIQTDMEERDHRNWIRIMAGGRFNTVGVKPSDSVTAFLFLDIYLNQKSKNFMRPRHDHDQRHLLIRISGKLQDGKNFNSVIQSLATGREIPQLCASVH